MPAQPAEGTPIGSLKAIPIPAMTTWLATVRAREGRLRVAGGIVAMAAALPVGAVIFLPSYYFRGVPYSLLSLPAAFVLEPLGVTILAVCAGIVMSWGKALARRWMAAGMLLAFGVQIFLYSWGTQYGISRPATAGSAGIVGMVGGLMLVSGAALGAFGIAAAQASPDLAGNQGSSDSANTAS